jgi:hypothetical protein
MIKLASVTLSILGSQGPEPFGVVATLVKTLVPSDHQAYPMVPAIPIYKGMNT